MASKKQQRDKPEQLAKRTIQILGFGFAIVLTAFKLFNPEADIPWYVPFGFFGAGASADGAFLASILGSRNGKK